MKVTILADNKVVNLRPPGLMAEWGFSALIEAEEVILFDAGQSVAYGNYRLLGKTEISKIVLSHGHYDHTSGLLPFLKDSSLRGVKLYAHPDAFSVRYLGDLYIGIPFRKEVIENFVKIVEHREPVRLTPSVWALGEIPRKWDEATLGTVIVDGRAEKDRILDDQSLALKTDGGVALILGCCHAGLLNTVEWAEEVTGDEVKYVVGGTHFIAYSEEKIKEIVGKLDIEMMAPCHCTGLKNEFLLSNLLGNRFTMVGSGSELTF